MSSVAHNGPITTIGGLLPGATEREAQQLVRQGYVEVYVSTPDQLQPRQFYRTKTRSGSTPAEMQWTIVKRTR